MALSLITRYLFQPLDVEFPFSSLLVLPQPRDAESRLLIDETWLLLAETIHGKEARVCDVAN